jgi:hypothetical protein
MKRRGETQQASEGGSAAQMSPIPSEIGNTNNKSTPSNTATKSIPPGPKKKGECIMLTQETFPMKESPGEVSTILFTDIFCYIIYGYFLHSPFL